MEYSKEINSLLGTTKSTADLVVGDPESILMVIIYKEIYFLSIRLCTSMFKKVTNNNNNNNKKALLPTL